MGGKDISLSHGIRLMHPQYIMIGDNSKIAQYSILEARKVNATNPLIEIGKDCNLGEFTHITSVRRVKLGNGVLTGRFVLITDNSHGKSEAEEIDLPPHHRQIYSKGEVIIEDNVWIGDKVTILPGVTIGKGSIIAAGAVVTKSIPPYTVAGGIPAKCLKTIKI